MRQQVEHKRMTEKRSKELLLSIELVADGCMPSTVSYDVNIKMAQNAVKEVRVARKPHTMDIIIDMLYFKIDSEEESKHMNVNYAACLQELHNVSIAH